MSIRLRTVEGVGLIAICAARSVEKPGDVYLDDAVHSALAVKFSLDFADEWVVVVSPYAGSPQAVAMEREESNNPNREWWDSQYAPPAADAKLVGVMVLCAACRDFSQYGSSIPETIQRFHDSGHSIDKTFGPIPESPT